MNIESAQRFVGWEGFLLCPSLRKVGKGRKIAKKIEITEKQQLEQHQVDEGTNPDQPHHPLPPVLGVWLS